MSISSITGSTQSPLPPPTDAAASKTNQDAKGNKGGGSAGDSLANSAASSTTITGTVTQTNADGTVTTVTTYADGTTTSTIGPNPNPVTSQGVLSQSNGGQLGTLLTAQEQSLAAGSTAAANAAQSVSANPTASQLGTLFSTQG